MSTQQRWDDLRIFLAIAEAQSVRGAARLLEVDHTTVSRRLAALQANLGVSLLNRVPGGYLLTPAGEDMMEVARTIRDQVEALDFRIFGRDAQLSGVVRLTVSEAISDMLVPDFTEFRLNHPGIRLEVVDQDILLDLPKREADIAVRFSYSPPEQLVGRRIWRDVPFAPYAEASLASEVLASGNLFDAPWVDWDHAFANAPHVRWLRHRVSEQRIVMRVSSTSMLRQMVREGAGLGLMFCGFGEPDPALTRVGDIIRDASLDLWVLTHADLRSSARIRACMDYIVTALQAKAPLFMNTPG